jgi:hypothetical protein
MSEDVSRYVLNGVYFEITPITKAKTDVGLLNLVATDGRRLALQEVDGITAKADFGTKNQPKGYIVPSAAVEMLLKVTARETSAVDITFGQLKKGDCKAYAQFAFQRKDGTQLRYVTRLVDGNYPAYRVIMPKDPQFSAHIDRAEFAAALATCEKCTTEKQHSVRLDFGADAIALHTKSDIGEASVQVGATFSGRKFQSIGFDPSFLLECAQHLKDRETITIDFIDELAPCVIHLPFFKYVLMPMRLPEEKTATKKTQAPAPIAKPIPAPVPPAAMEVKPEPQAPAIIPWAGADTLPAEKCFILSRAHLFFVTVTDAQICCGDSADLPSGLTLAQIAGNKSDRVLCRAHYEGKYWYAWCDRAILGDLPTSENIPAGKTSAPRVSLLDYAKSKLPAAVAALITAESQVESYRAQWEKDCPALPVEMPAIEQKQTEETKITAGNASGESAPVPTPLASLPSVNTPAPAKVEIDFSISFARARRNAWALLNAGNPDALMPYWDRRHAEHKRIMDKLFSRIVKRIGVAGLTQSGIKPIGNDTGPVIPAAKLVPIEDLYAQLIAAVNRGDLDGAQTLAARIAA